MLEIPMKMPRSIPRSLALAAIAFPSSMVLADNDVPLEVRANSTATIHMQLYIDTLVGSDSGWDSATVAVTGDGGAVLSPSEPFTDMSLTALDTNLGNASFNYDLLCVPIFGCSAPISVSITDFNMVLVDAVSASIGAGGAVNFVDASFNPSADFNAYVGGVIDSSFGGAFDEIVVSDFTVIANINESVNSLLLTNPGINSFTYAIDPASLPGGVYAVQITVDVDLSNTKLYGTYSDAIAGDLNGDGEVDGGDLGILLSQFNSTGVADLNGDGTVNGADLGLLLNYWTG
jgi:hypothetical protein